MLAGAWHGCVHGMGVCSGVFSMFREVRGALEGVKMGEGQRKLRLTQGPALSCQLGSSQDAEETRPTCPCGCPTSRSCTQPPDKVGCCPPTPVPTPTCTALCLLAQSARF